MNNKEKVQWLANFYSELAKNNNGYQFVNNADEWVNGGIDQYPNIHNTPKWFKVNPPKPRINKIDLSIMVNSGIDMEFANEQAKDWYVYKLIAIKDDRYYSNNKVGTKCRIRQDHWHSWQGGKNCPLPEGLVIVHSNLYDQHRRWNNRCTNYNSFDWRGVYEFKVTGTAKGWEYI